MSRGMQYPILMLLALTLASSAVSQVTSGTILGAVSDSNDGRIAGANVTVSNDTGLTRTSHTWRGWILSVPRLTRGYLYPASECRGFKKTTESNVFLSVAEDAVLNKTMQVDAVDEVVHVSSQAPLVDTTSSTLGSLIGETTVAQLPLNGRNYVDLTLLQPGITQQTQRERRTGNHRHHLQQRRCADSFE